jgi:LemA protein
MKKMLVWLVPLAIIALIAGSAMGNYNGFVTGEELVQKQWGEVETQYQRRFDLIPNLVETVKGYADFEQETLTAVTQARAAALGAMKQAGETGDLGDFEQKNMVFGGALRGLLGYTEQYPDLKANANFRDLQAQLEGTENRIATARSRYNEVVQTYNADVRKFPGRFWAAMFGFEAKDYFESASGAEQAPAVNFGS